MDTEKTPRHIFFVRNIFIGLFLLIGVFFAGVYIGFENRPAFKKITNVVNKESMLADTADFNLFWEAWQTVSEKLPDAEKTKTEDKVYGAIKGMLSSFGDPYTTFFDPEETKQFEDEISGEFGGVGIELGRKDGVLTVVAPLKNTPAYKAGILSGDIIYKIDEELSADISVEKAISLIRGTPGTSVKLSIVREGLSEPKVFEVERAIIQIPTVETKQFPEEKVFVIQLYNFSAQSSELFRKALVDFNNTGYERLILDLRGNPGGYLESAVQMAGWFIPKGEVVVKEIGKNDSDTVLHRSPGPGILKDTVKMLVLVNGGSASASEILAGALSEYGVAKLVGQKTFGKGSVQELVKISPDTSLKVTIAKWYTPKGVSISDEGLNPEIKIPDSKESQNDTQLKKAVELLQ